jgi:5,6,7,8-tetrahydromethanopterin hydro-lyase
MNTIMGEADVGDGAEAAHVVLAIGSKGAPFETSFLNALTHRARGQMTSIALLEPNLPCKPFTLITNETTLRTANQATVLLGPINAAVAHSVIDAVAGETIPRAMVDQLLIIVTVFVPYEAKVTQRVYDNHYAAALLAIERAFNGEPGIDEILGKRDTAKHFFYQPHADQEDLTHDG